MSGGAGPTRGAQPGPAVETLEVIGERAIVHHFACQQRSPLRWALVPGAVNYLCDECGARVSVGADGRQMGSGMPALSPDAPRGSGSTDAGYPTLGQILAAQAELEGSEKPSGARSIARYLGCNESTVRRRLGRRK